MTTTSLTSLISLKHSFGIQVDNCHPIKYGSRTGIKNCKFCNFTTERHAFIFDLARTVILEVDCDDEVEFFLVYQGLQDAIDAVEGPENKKLARFPLVKDSMIPMSRENLKIKG